MTDLVPFEFETHPIRVQRNGETWFVAADVCDALGIEKHQNAVQRLDEDERGTLTAGTPGGPQQVAAISEAGVYRLIFTSRKPEAERFKRWLAHEVLPALRRTGTYGLPGRLAQLTSAELRRIEARAQKILAPQYEAALARTKEALIQEFIEGRREAGAPGRDGDRHEVTFGEFRAAVREAQEAHREPGFGAVVDNDEQLVLFKGDRVTRDGDRIEIVGTVRVALPHGYNWEPSHGER